MWENQSLFRVSAQLFADGVFNLLDRALKASAAGDTAAAKAASTAALIA